MRTLCFIGLILCSGISFSQQNKSIHQEQSEYYSNLGVLSDSIYDQMNGFKLLNPSKNSRACDLNKIVFGWHPYWNGSTYLNYDWKLLSDLSYFSYEVDPATGNASTTHSWATADAVDSALANGVRVNLCVTLFSDHATFFANGTARQTLITNLINLVQSRGAHGVNIDFEGVPSSQKANLTAFLIDLCNQMHGAIPGSQISIALYAVDWSTVFDIPALNNYLDLFIIMGYDYYWTGSSTAGPNSGLYSFQSSYDYNVSKSINYYLYAGVSPQKLVVGLPYYGRDYPTSSSSVPSSTTNDGSSKTYKVMRDNSLGYYDPADRQWDANSFVPYWVYNNGSWHQCFADDEVSLGYKYDIVHYRDIAGIGIWALGYDDGYTELWDLIEQKFTTCYSQQCSDTIYDTGGPTRNYYINGNYEYTISPPGAYAVSLNFTQFGLESGHDSLWIYDGPSSSSPLIGAYSGTSSPGTVVSTGEEITIKFHSDGATGSTGYTAVWNCLTDTQDPVTTITAGNWETQDFQAGFTDTDNGTINYRFWQVLDFNTTEWRANGNSGFLNDNFNSAIHADWTQSMGTWSIDNSRLKQSDEAQNYTRIFAQVNQTDAYSYLYHWQMKIGGSGTNRRSGMHFFGQNPDSSNFNSSYMVYLRADNNKVQLYKYTNNVAALMADVTFTIDTGIWYDVKTILDPQSGLFRVFVNDNYVAEWTDPSPFSSGSYVSARTGNCITWYDDIKVYRSRSTSEIVAVGPGNMVRYQNPDPGIPSCRIKSLITDQAGNISSPGTRDVNIDWTPPTTGLFVNDGNSADIDTTSITTELPANWDTFSDSHSGLNQYLYAAGTTPGATDVVPWTNGNLTANAIISGLSLTPGDTVFFMVKAVNNAGLESDSIVSDGLYILNGSSLPAADFVAMPNFNCNTGPVQFTNLSSDFTSCFWTFSGGTPSTSTATSPFITYNTPGIYDVLLVVVNPFGSDTLLMSDYIHIGYQQDASFIVSDSTGNPPFIVTFTNTSQGATSYLWNFGDGTTSTDFQPYHIYSSPGSYPVTLIAYNPTCPDDTSSVHTISVVLTDIQFENQATSRLYPVPATDYCIIETEMAGTVMMEISNNLGIVCLQKEFPGPGKFETDLSGLAEGYYSVKISGQGGTRVHRLIITGWQ